METNHIPIGVKLFDTDYGFGIIWSVRPIFKKSLYTVRFYSGFTKERWHHDMIMAYERFGYVRLDLDD